MNKLKFVVEIIKKIKNCIKNNFKIIYEDAKNIKEKDPAAKSLLEVILLYSGFHALFFHHIAHAFYNKKLLIDKKL